jgi:hypothetical protein
MSDLKAATTEFFAKVDRHAPDQAKRVREVLNDLLKWSDEQGLRFFDQDRKGSIRYCVRGVSSALWVFTPHTKDGARLTLLADSQFPEDLRTEARQILAQLDGRKPEPNEVPTVGYLKLLWPANRATLYDLMSRVVGNLGQA